MAYFIKTGFWEQKRKGPKEWLNLNWLIESISSQEPTPVALDNSQSTLDISSPSSTLSSSSATKTFTISYTGSDSALVVTLNATSATYTFPANSLCVSEGEASGDNTLALAGSSGDKYVIGIKNIGGTYYVVAKNFGQ